MTIPTWMDALAAFASGVPAFGRTGSALRSGAGGMRQCCCSPATCASERIITVSGVAFTCTGEFLFYTAGTTFKYTIQLDSTYFGFLPINAAINGTFTSESYGETSGGLCAYTASIGTHSWKWIHRQYDYATDTLLDTRIREYHSQPISWEWTTTKGGELVQARLSLPNSDPWGSVSSITTTGFRPFAAYGESAAIGVAIANQMTTCYAVGPAGSLETTLGTTGTVTLDA